MKERQNKILVIRFSSMGDIVLTTPVLRCIKTQANAEIHYVLKKSFADVLKGNPHIDRIFTFEKDISEIMEDLRKEKYDHVVDLHNNLRSLRLKKALGVPSSSFKKLNVRKFLAVNFKMTSALPPVHIVQRYLDAAAVLGVKNDRKGLEHYLLKEDEVGLPEEVFTALVVGGSYFTKKIPFSKLQEICSTVKGPVLLIGSKEDGAGVSGLPQKFSNVQDLCGRLSIGQSAYVISKAAQVITGDTGMMHIAAAHRKKIFSFWGNTLPEFGMYPYMPGEGSRILEVKGLKCRPCSKLGFSKCPKEHFRCMTEIDISSSGLH